MPGWYYERQLQWITDPRAPQGEHFVTFANEQEGRSAHLLQGLPIDGRAVSEIELSAWIRYRNLPPLRAGEAPPSVGITFYDESRKELGHNFLGPFRGSAEWTHVKKAVRVPPTAREGLLRIGLFGATGEISFDAVAIKAVSKRP